MYSWQSNQCLAVMKYRQDGDLSKREWDKYVKHLAPQWRSLINQINAKKMMKQYTRATIRVRIQWSLLHTNKTKIHWNFTLHLDDHINAQARDEILDKANDQCKDRVTINAYKQDNDMPGLGWAGVSTGCSFHWLVIWSRNDQDRWPKEEVTTNINDS